MFKDGEEGKLRNSETLSLTVN